MAVKNADKSQKNNIKNIHIPSIALVFIIFTMTMWSVYLHPFVIHWISNADQLTIIMLIDDVIKDIGYIETWSFSRAPYLFPDATLLLLVELILKAVDGAGSVLSATLLSAIIQLGGIFALTAYIVQKSIGSSYLDSLIGTIATCSIITIGAIFLSAIPYMNSYFAHFFKLFYTPLHHIGAFVAAYWCICTTYKIVFDDCTSKAFIAWLGVIGITSILATVSNPLFLLYFTLPTVLTIGLVWPITQRRQAAFVILTIIVTGVIGYQTFQHLERTAVFGGEQNMLLVYLQREAAFLSLLARLLVDNWMVMAPTFLAPVLLIAIGAGRSIAGIWLRRAEAGQKAANSGLMFFTIIAAVSIALITVAIGAKFERPGYTRYYMPGFIWPLVFCCFYGVRLFTAGLAGRFGLLLAGGVVTAIMPAWNGFARPRIDTPEIRCAQSLETQRATLGLRDGIAGYWAARPVTMATDWRIAIAQGTIYGSNTLWNVEVPASPPRPRQTNFILLWRPAGLFDDAAWHAAPAGRFAVADTALDEWWRQGIEESNAFLKAHYGPPDRIASCGPADVWIYDRPGYLDARYLATLDLRPFISQLSLRGATEIPGPALPGDTGHLNGMVREAAGPLDAPGKIVDLHLPAAVGTYRLDLTYSYRAAFASAAGPSLQSIAGTIPLNEGTQQTIGATITVAGHASSPAPFVNAAVTYPGEGRLTIHALRITRQ